MGFPNYSNFFSAINFMLNNESMQDLSSRHEQHTGNYTYQYFNIYAIYFFHTIYL